MGDIITTFFGSKAATKRDKDIFNPDRKRRIRTEREVKLGLARAAEGVAAEEQAGRTRRAKARGGLDPGRRAAARTTRGRGATILTGGQLGIANVALKRLTGA